MADGVVGEAPEVRTRRLLHVLELGSNLRAVVPAADEPGERAAGVRQIEAELREAVHHAAEDEMRHGNAGVVWIAAEVLEVVLLRAILADRVDRMQEDGPAKLLALRIDVPELLLIELLAIDVGREVHAFDARKLGGALELF